MKSANDKKILLVGCGDVATQLGLNLLQKGYSITGLRRNVESLPGDFETISADVSMPEQLVALAQQDYLVVVITLAPSERSEIGYRTSYYEGTKNILAALGEGFNGLILFASSTSVYHQNDGSWVDETSQVKPSSYTGEVMLATENLLASRKADTSCVRFGGIYGRGKNLFLSQIANGACWASEDHYTNRIHSEDCSGVLEHLVERYISGETVEQCYLAVDEEPALLSGVAQWLRGKLTQVASVDTGLVLNRRGGSKRCSNALLLAQGYQFKYPSYREGYKETIARMNRR